MPLPAEEEEEEAPMQVGMDAYDIATPVDIFKTYNEAFFESVFTLDKWDKKKAKLDEFLEKGKKNPRFANVNVGWISQHREAALHGLQQECAEGDTWHLGRRRQRNAQTLQCDRQEGSGRPPS